MGRDGQYCKNLCMLSSFLVDYATSAAIANSLAPFYVRRLTTVVELGCIEVISSAMVCGSDVGETP